MKNLLSNNTEKWYQSRVIWLGVALIAEGISSQNWLVATAGVAQIVLRFLTKKEIQLVKR